MGTFHVGCKLENHTDRTQTVTVPRALVDTGSETTWIPSKTLGKIGVVREKKDLVFTMANGQTITLSVGFAILRVDKYFTIDEVVFFSCSCEGNCHSSISSSAVLFTTAKLLVIAYFTGGNFETLSS
jgi:hypothetical protein